MLPRFARQDLAMTAVVIQCLPLFSHRPHHAGNCGRAVLLDIPQCKVLQRLDMSRTCFIVSHHFLMQLT